MPNYTPKLNLEKPLGTEYYNVLAVQNVNSDKIDANAIDTDLKNDCMAGGDIKGYIEDGGSHVVGEIWLSRNSVGEFKCLLSNTDIFVDLTPGAEKWVQIDDKTSSNRLTNLEYSESGVLGPGITYIKTGKVCIISFDEYISPQTVTHITLPEHLKALSYVRGIIGNSGAATPNIVEFGVLNDLIINGYSGAPVGLAGSVTYPTKI